MYFFIESCFNNKFPEAKKYDIIKCFSEINQDYVRQTF